MADVALTHGGHGLDCPLPSSSLHFNVRYLAHVAHRPFIGSITITERQPNPVVFLCLMVN